jgi:patatin-like phospholipase/acyl hydrolase
VADKRVVKILSIDGGGIRGIIPATILVELEKLTQKRISQSFDLIAGTSTGGILASVLSSNRNYTAKDALNIYMKRGSDIFSRNLNHLYLGYTQYLRENRLDTYFGV